MKILILVFLLILFNKNVYSNSIFDSSFHNIEFNSENIDDDKIQAINKINMTENLQLKSQINSNSEKNHDLHMFFLFSTPISIK